MQPSAHCTIVHTDETESTNNLVKEVARRFPQQTLAVASTDFQTCGRGQRGNSWESERGQNLLCSLFCRPTFLLASKQFALSQAIAASIKDELDTYTPDIRIKWPNDIYWREKKIAGILIENDLQGSHIGSSVIGVGLNLNQTTFRSDAPNPVSLLQITGRRFVPGEVLAHVSARFEAYYAQIAREETEALARHYRESLLRGEGYHRFRDARGEFTARIHHIEPDGHLVLQDEGGILRSYAFKEVSHIF